MSQWSVCLCGDSCRLKSHTSYIVRAVEELSCMKVDGICVCVVVMEMS